MPLYFGGEKRKITLNNESSGVHTYFAFTITYYDSDGVTVLKTEKLPFGSMPSYTPTKDGMIFEGWTTELVAVAGSASYIAKWKERPNFTTASWAEIAEISESGQASEYFKVGDTKDIPLTYADGTTETITVAIAGFNHDDKADGNGKAGISFVCMSVPSKTTHWANWTGAVYATSLIHGQLTDTILPSLPSDLQTVIKPVNKKYDNSNTSGTGTAISRGFNLWALSVDELGISESAIAIYPNYSTILGTRYPIFPLLNASLPVATLPTVTDANGENVEYYTRHLWRNGDLSAISIKNNGKYNNNSGYSTSKAYHVRFGFCI